MSKPYCTICGHDEGDHKLSSFDPQRGCTVCPCTSYVAPPEPSRVPLWPTDSGQYEPHVKPEAVEGEAKPQIGKSLGNPKSQWGDPRVAKVYELLCADNEELADKPDEEHWEGYIARLIVDALCAVATPTAPPCKHPDVCGDFCDCATAPPEVVELPPLDDDCNEDDVHLRAERWIARVFDIIDDGDAADGDAPNHAGIEAEWDLIQRERQLAAEIAAHAQTKAALAEAEKENETLRWAVGQKPLPPRPQDR